MHNARNLRSLDLPKDLGTMLGVMAEAQLTNDPDGRMVIPWVSSGIFLRLTSTRRIDTHLRRPQQVSTPFGSGHLLTHSTSRQEGLHRTLKMTNRMNISQNSLLRGTHPEGKFKWTVDQKVSLAFNWIILAPAVLRS
jgi:hypothetical protein